MAPLRAIVLAAGGPAGLGHLARSTALAQALAVRGVEVSALQHGADGDVVIDGLRWSAGPGDSEREAALLIADGYGIEPEDLSRFRAKASFWMHPPDPSQVGSDGSALYLDAAGEDAPDRLAGLGYSCLRRAYWSRAPRAPAERVERVLVTIGGSDAGGPVGELAEAVAGLAPDARVSMVRGPLSSSAAACGVTSIDAPDSLHPLLAASDLVVSAAGQTMLEALCCGVPTVALVRASNQRAQADSVADAGAALVTGEDGLGRSIGSLLSDADLRRSLSGRGQELIDGLGAHRVADELLARLCGEPEFTYAELRLRRAREDDSDFLFELRNDPSAYRYFRTPAPVEADEHERWLAGVLADRDSDLLIIERGGAVIGNVRLHPQERGMEGLEVGISLSADARGRGIGRTAIEASAAFAFVRRGATALVASIGPLNAASLAAFSAAGFEHRDVDPEGFQILVLHRRGFRWGGESA